MLAPNKGWATEGISLSISFSAPGGWTRALEHHDNRGTESGLQQMRIWTFRGNTDRFMRKCKEKLKNFIVIFNIIMLMTPLLKIVVCSIFFLSSYPLLHQRRGAMRTNVLFTGPCVWIWWCVCGVMPYVSYVCVYGTTEHAVQSPLQQNVWHPI